MLRAAASLSSRSVFVTGHSVSAVGLTAAVGRDSRAAGGDIVIEAGALVICFYVCLRMRASVYVYVCVLLCMLCMCTSVYVYICEHICI